MESKHTKGEWVANDVPLIFKRSEGFEYTEIALKEGGENWIAWVQKDDDADYIVKAVNSHEELVKALQSLIYDVKDWRDYNDSQADSFEGNEKKMVQDIATDITDRLRNAKAVLQKVNANT